MNTSQVLTVDKSRLAPRIGGLEEAEMRQVDQALGVSLALTGVM